MPQLCGYSRSFHWFVLYLQMWSGWRAQSMYWVRVLCFMHLVTHRYQPHHLQHIVLGTTTLLPSRYFVIVLHTASYKLSLLPATSSLLFFHLSYKLQISYIFSAHLLYRPLLPYIYCPSLLHGRLVEWQLGALHWMHLYLRTSAYLCLQLPDEIYTFYPHRGFILPQKLTLAPHRRMEVVMRLRQPWNIAGLTPWNFQQAENALGRTVRIEWYKLLAARRVVIQNSYTTIEPKTNSHRFQYPTPL